LRPYIHDFAICYLDDILIYWYNEKKHNEQVQKVLERLTKLGLYCKPNKCQFGVSEVGFLGFVISSEGVGIESDRISTIEAWPTPKSVQDVQVLLGFANFYRRFFRKYAKVTLPLTELLKSRACGGKKSSRFSGEATTRSQPITHKREWNREAQHAFQKLKMAFTEAPILQNFDLAKPIILQTDASGFAVADILNQYDGFGTLRPVNFYSRKCISAEQNDDPYDRKLQVIVETMKQWRH